MNAVVLRELRFSAGSGPCSWAQVGTEEDCSKMSSRSEGSRQLFHKKGSFVLVLGY